MTRRPGWTEEVRNFPCFLFINFFKLPLTRRVLLPSLPVVRILQKNMYIDVLDTLNHMLTQVTQLIVFLTQGISFNANFGHGSSKSKSTHASAPFALGIKLAHLHVSSTDRSITYNLKVHYMRIGSISSEP